MSKLPLSIVRILILQLCSGDKSLLFSVYTSTFQNYLNLTQAVGVLIELHSVDAEALCKVAYRQPTMPNI